MLKPKLLETGRWWDDPLTLVEGCTKVSEGCAHCWSEAIARRFKHHWTPRFRGDRLTIPLRAMKPRVYAVWNDLFHECVTNAQIAAAFGVMATAKQHDFMVLTKRPERVRAFMAWLGSRADYAVMRCGTHAVSWNSEVLSYCMSEAMNLTACDNSVNLGPAWPPPNVALGVTVESQEHEARVGALLGAWPGLTFVSCEPLLGPTRFLADGICEECGHRFFSSKATRLQCPTCGTSHDSRPDAVHYLRKPCLVIAGGETGAKPRPSHPDWFRSLRDQCAAAGVPFLFKQWGEWREAAPDIEWQGENPSNYRFSEVNGTRMVRVGRKLAGRFLDGRTHDGWFGGEA